MREIDLIVIGDQACGTTRAYLSYLNYFGFKPKHLWLTRFLPASSLVKKIRNYPFGTLVSNLVHRRQSVPESSFSKLFIYLCKELQNVVTVPIDFCGKFDFSAYAANVEELVVEDFDDPYLQSKVCRLKDKYAFLYTNGGIVPEGLLNKPGLRIFHVHPGVVPYMRGSDCFLWSNLVRGRPGASCFYMNPGIDEGDILATMEFSCPDLSFIKPVLSEDNEDTIYRALSYALDPHMRAMLFTKVVADAGGIGLREFSGVKQVDQTHQHYLWMHPKLRYKVIQDIVCNEKAHGDGKLEPILK